MGSQGVSGFFSLNFRFAYREQYEWNKHGFTHNLLHTHTTYIEYKELMQNIILASMNGSQQAQLICS